ncbi:MAG TPA: DEAD/DEAH box helicase [Candidatus Saccharimonadales bacterium]|nr:DEAD/DEAH box helicase [Candidatus Saccharimonadales bacterium]
MYQNSRNSGFKRTSIRGNRNRFGRPANGGGFNRGFNGNNRGFQNRPRVLGPKSKLTNADHNIFIKKASEAVVSESYQPHNSFIDFAINDTLKRNIVKRGYTQPTPIQDKAIQPILDGRDLIGLANTGTGKTAAFLIPLIDKMVKNRNERVLIITPTRELAGQINTELKEFSFGLNIFSSIVIGGANLHRQMSDLRRRPNVVIGTPGRIKDLIERRALNLADFKNFVLDEVDLMVDIGFIRDVQYFISLLPVERQSLFFSATIPPKVQDILQAFVRDAVTVSVQTQPTSENVDQDVVRVLDRNKKVDQLHDLLIKDEFNKVMIFGRTKHGIEKLNKQLTSRGFSVGAIHGNRTQGQRQRILRSFKEDQINILLATDVASRGLDIDNVSHVINYDLPETYEDYIHRIGRTGRADKKGKALTFVE